MAQIAYLWVAQKVDAPLLGLSKEERMQEFVDVIGTELSAEEVKYLEEPYVPRAVFGHS